MVSPLMQQPSTGRLWSVLARVFDFGRGARGDLSEVSVGIGGGFGRPSCMLCSERDACLANTDIGTKAVAEGHVIEVPIGTIVDPFALGGPEVLGDVYAVVAFVPDAYDGDWDEALAGMVREGMVPIGSVVTTGGDPPTHVL